MMLLGHVLPALASLSFHVVSRSVGRPVGLSVCQPTLEIFGEFRTGKTQICHTVGVVGRRKPIRRVSCQLEILTHWVLSPVVVCDSSTSGIAWGWKRQSLRDRHRRNLSPGTVGPSDESAVPSLHLQQKTDDVVCSLLCAVPCDGHPYDIFFVILCSIAGIAERYGLEPEACLENIVYARAYTHEHMFTLLTEGSFCVCTRARIRAEIEYKYIYVCSRLCVSRFV
jgi:Rad51